MRGRILARTLRPGSLSKTDSARSHSLSMLTYVTRTAEPLLSISAVFGITQNQ